MALQELARKFIFETDRCLFITGKAGTGKTTFLREIVSSTFKSVVVAAPTGIAAINAGGVTLHSLFQLPFGLYIPNERGLSFNESNSKISTPRTLMAQIKLHSNKRKLIKQMDLLIIDEVSMLRADLLDAIDNVLRSVRRRPYDRFGGVQVIFFGDLLQLPPVVQNHEWQYLREYYPSMYFFDSLALRDNPPLYVEFDKVFRQTDNHFISILNQFRDHEVDWDTLEDLNARYDPEFDHRDNPGYIHITTHNRKADAINQERLEELTGKSFKFRAEISGDFGEHMYPNEEVLYLKKGAQVMFIKNDPTGEGKFYNGKIGRISYLDEESIYVTLDGAEEDDEVKVQPYIWENKKYTLDKITQDIEENTVGSYTQMPLKLAWAVTVHKSQGLTFEKAILDLSETFAPGQMYVALSRLTSLEGLVLSAKIPNSRLLSDPLLSEFISENQNKQPTEADLGEGRIEFFTKYIQKSFSFDDLIQELNDHAHSYRKKDGKSSNKAEHAGWARELVNELFPIKDTGIKFQRQIQGISIKTEISDEEKVASFLERVEKARNYFNPILEKSNDKLIEHISEISVKKGMKTYAKELMNLKALFLKQFLSMKKAYILVHSAHTGESPEKDKVEDLQEDIEKELRTEPKKPSKKSTYQQSFDLYKEGKTVEEIADERGMVISTILGHMARYVESGDLPATDFIEIEMLDNILKVIETAGTESMGDIKSKLGDEYTWADVKMGIAEWKRREGE